MITHVQHKSGQFVSYGPLTLPATKADPQGFGSATTYAKRYALCAVFGVIADQDDDGQLSSGRNAPKNASKEQIQVAKELLKKIATDNGMTEKQAEQVCLDYLKISNPLEKTNNEEIGLILNYLNSKK